MSLNSSVFAKLRGSLSLKLVAGFLGAGLLASVAVGVGAYWVASDVVHADVEHTLENVAKAEKHGLELYFQSVEADLDYMASASATRNGLKAFAKAWEGQKPADLQKAYIDDNPHPLGEKHLLDAAPGDAAYHAQHADFHPTIRTFLEVRGYYDIFLISPAGDIVYSVFKERDYATNLLNGEYKDSGLGAAFRKALAGEKHAFVDFEPYAPSYGAPAAFVAEQVKDAKGAVIGVVAMQIPSDKIAAAVAVGAEAVSFTIGADGKLRTDLKATDESDILVRSASGDWIKSALAADKPVVVDAAGVLGVESMIAAMKVDVLGAQWLVVAEEPLEVAMAPLAHLRATMLWVTPLIMLVIAALSYIVASRLGRSVGALSSVMLDISKGELDQEIPGLDGKDEIGRMANALATFRENAGVQLAVTAAVQSNRTPMLLLDRDGDVITANAAFEGLWTDIAGAVGDLKAAPVGDAQANFAPLLRRAEEVEAQGGELKQKANGDRSLDVPHGGLIIELKRSPIKNAAGQTVGTAIEIDDVTDVRKIEGELVAVIESVERGEFDKRVTFIDRLGFASVAATGLNSLMEAMSNFMGELEGSLDALARGDVTRPMSGDFRGDFDVARNRFNASIESLRSTLQNVSGAAERVRAEAAPIAEGSRDLASRAEAQASTLEQTAATMEEMSATIKMNADNAERAAGVSAQACEMAEAGGQVVGDTVTAMARIEESSTKISDIISVIEGISFQTNLLALNAAVEAARAGEAGKGFAVVASEVRTLAQRSSEAAKDIKDLIETSSSHVADGVSLVNRTGDSLSELVTAIRSVATSIGEISNSVKEQAAGVHEITASVSHLDEMTQQNAMLADQSASSAQGLLGAAGDLSEQIHAFKTGPGDASAPSVSSAALNASAAPRRAAPAPAAPAPAPVKVAANGDWADF